MATADFRLRQGCGRIPLLLKWSCDNKFVDRGDRYRSSGDSALSASVRAMRTVMATSPTHRQPDGAATSFWIASEVGTRTFPPRCPHFLAEDELILVVNPGRSCLNHRFHQLKGIQGCRRTQLRRLQPLVQTNGRCSSLQSDESDRPESESG